MEEAARLVEEVLQTWRLGERLLEELPPVDPDHEAVRLHVAELRELYRVLTESSAASETRIGASEALVKRARAAIDGASSRLQPDGAGSA